MAHKQGKEREKLVAKIRPSVGQFVDTISSNPFGFNIRQLSFIPLHISAKGAERERGEEQE